MHIHRPAYAGPGNRVPAVVFVPGGTGFGSSFDATGLPDDIASDGFAFLHFDPDGRGQRGAYPENYDGYVPPGRDARLPAVSRIGITWIRAGWASTRVCTVSRWGRA